MKRKSVFIFGKNGRMGQEVAKIIKKTPSLYLTGGVSKEDKDYRTDLSLILSLIFLSLKLFPILKISLKNTIPVWFPEQQACMKPKKNN